MLDSQVDGRKPGRRKAKKDGSTRATTAQTATRPKQFTTSVACRPNSLPRAFVAAVQTLEESLDMPVFLLIHGLSNHPFPHLDPELLSQIRKARSQIAGSSRLALLIDSPGGDGGSAYRIARFLREHCGGFVALIPHVAKSAATLLTLGADDIILGRDAELGPLDVQVMNPDQDDLMSALDEVQALERLHAFALEAVDSTMFLLFNRTRRKPERLLPLVLTFVSDFMRPLAEKIDAVHYTQMSRQLRVGEEYATRLLRRKYGSQGAEKIANKLVHAYPEHGFVIDRDELEEIGLETTLADSAQQEAFDALQEYLPKVTAIGTLTGVPS